MSTSQCAVYQVKETSESKGRGYEKEKNEKITIEIQLIYSWWQVNIILTTDNMSVCQALK